MKTLICCITLVIILVLVNSSTEHCGVLEGTNRNEAHCGKHDTDSTFYTIPEILRDITYIDLWGQPLKQLANNAFKVLQSQRNLTIILLQFCQIANIDVNAFMNLDNLELVDLSFNNISQVHIGTFENVPKVKYIYLEHNIISVLPKGFLDNLTSLIRIHLNYNRIAHIEEGAFKNTPELRYIDLSNNKLQTLDMSFRDYFVNKTYLYLHDNPWTCNRSLTGIYDYLLQYNRKYNWSIKYMPRCEKPVIIRGRKWNEISLDVNRYIIAPQELNDKKEEPPKTSLLALLVGEISGISFIALFVIFIAYMYNIRQIIFDKLIRSHEMSNIE